MGKVQFCQLVSAATLDEPNQFGYIIYNDNTGILVEQVKVGPRGKILTYTELFCELFEVFVYRFKFILSCT